MTYLMRKGLLSRDHLGSQHDAAVLCGGGAGEVGVAGRELARCTVLSVDLIYYPYIVILSGIPANEVFYVDVISIGDDACGDIIGNTRTVYAIDTGGGIAI